MNPKLLTLAIILCLCASLSFAGCAQVKYGGAEYTRLGDVKTKGAYVENIIGPAKVTVDPNTGLHNYLLDANGIYTRFSFDSQESKGELNIDTLAATIAEAVTAALGGT